MTSTGPDNPGGPAPPVDLDETLSFAQELAGLADAVTLPAFRNGVTAEVKADGTPVTAADREAERRMRRAIGRRYPDHAVLGEEDGLIGDADAPTWILDPIDGTSNYARGVPVFATLIALSVDDRPLVGVVSAPALASRWDARADGHARHNHDPIRVSDTGRLADAHVSFGGLAYFTQHDWPELVASVTRATARQRGFGDFWQHCLVAMGAVDLAIEAEVSRWDLAAVKVLVEAAGGRLTSVDGRDTDAGGSALSSNGHLHEQALDLVP